MADTSLVFNLLAKDRVSDTVGKVGGNIAGMGKRFGKSGGMLGRSLMGGFVASIGATAGQAGMDMASQFFAGTIGGAANLEAAMGAVGQVFGKAQGPVQRWAKTTDQALGISQTAALAASKDFGAMFTSTGMSAKGAATLSMEWVELSANMAAFRDVNPTQALEAMQSALRGELDPLQQFIPAVSAASIEQKALAMAGKDVATELTQQDKVLAINALMMESTANKAGEAERAQGGASVQAARATAQFQNMQATLGMAVLPLLTKLGAFLNAHVLPALKQMVSWIQQNSTWLLPLAAALGIGATAVWAIGAATRTFAAIQTVARVATVAWTAAQWLLNAALRANPIGIVITVLMALVGVFVLAWKRSAKFRAIVTGAWNGIRNVAGSVGRWFTGTLWPWIRGVWDRIGAGAGGVYRTIKRWLGRAIDFVGGLPGRISRAAAGLWDGIKSGLSSAVNWVIGKLNDAIGALNSMISGANRVPGVSIPHVPYIPYLADGGTILRGGTAMVGERGPELVSLPRGAQVSPLDRAGAGGSGPVVIRVDASGGSGLDRVFLSWLQKALRANPGVRLETTR